MDGFDVDPRDEENGGTGGANGVEPIDEEGNECGPPEAAYAVPDGPQLN